MKFILSLLFFMSAAYGADPGTSHGSIPVSVLDSRTGQPVSAEVYLGKEKKIYTDESGSCRFDSIIPGLYQIVIVSAEYDTFVEPTVQIHNGSNPMFTAELKKKAEIQELDRMVVVGNTLSRKSPVQTTSVTRITNYEISSTPGTANDINRILSSHPSVMTSVGADFDNTIYVRGGQSYENMYVIDGIELENANHFSSVYRSGGAIGFINSLLVKDLEFYAGAFPASSPSVLSSVIDVHLRSGSIVEPKFEADLNVTGLGLTLEGPLTQKASYLANVRLADFSLLKPLITSEGMPRFGDGVLKAAYSPDESNLLRFTLIGALDNYKEEYDVNDYSVPTTYDQWVCQAGAIGSWEFNNGKWRNQVSLTGSLRDINSGDYVYNFKDTITDSSLINYSYWKKENTIIDSLLQPSDTMYIEYRYYTGKEIWNDHHKRLRASVNDKFSLFLRDNDQLNMGFSAYNHRYSVARQSASASRSYMFRVVDGAPELIPDSIWTTLPYKVDSTIDVQQVSGYAEYVYSQGPFKTVAGLRGDYFTVLTDYGISPRLGMSMDVPGAGTFLLSGGLYYQFPAEFSGLIEEILAANPNNSFSNKAPLDKTKLQRCWQAAAGFYKEFTGSHIINLETYLKWYDREYPFSSPGSRQYLKLTNNGIKWLLDKPEGKKRAYGLELTFQKKNYDRFFYAFYGSLFQVENQYTDGKWYNDEKNARGTLGLTVGFNSRHQGISLRASGSGGAPYVSIAYDKRRERYYLDTAKTYYSEFLDPLLSISLRYSLKLYPKWGSVLAYFELWNILNYTPVVERYFNPWTGYNDFRSNGILPIGGITVDF